MRNAEFKLLQAQINPCTSFIIQLELRLSGWPRIKDGKSRGMTKKTNNLF